MVARSTMIDWDLAVTAASRLAGPGPEITRSEAQAAVAELHAGAERSTLVNEGSRVLVEGSMEAPSSMVRNSDGTQNEAAIQARSVVPSKK